MIKCLSSLVLKYEKVFYRQNTDEMTSEVGINNKYRPDIKRKL